MHVGNETGIYSVFCYLDESVAQRSAVVYRHGYWCGLPGTVSVWGPGSDWVS